MTPLFGYAFTKEGRAKMRSVIPYGLAGMLLTTRYFSFVGSIFHDVNTGLLKGARTQDPAS
jgi:hypothetical protein